MDVDDARQPVGDGIEGVALLRGWSRLPHQIGEIGGHPVRGSAQRLVPLDELQLRVRRYCQDKVPQRAVDRDGAGPAHVDQAVRRRAHGATDVRQRFGSDEHAESGITKGDALAHGIWWMPADGWVDVPGPADLDPRLDDVANLYDARRLARLDQIQGDVADARIGEHERAHADGVDHQPP